MTRFDAADSQPYNGPATSPLVEQFMTDVWRSLRAARSLRPDNSRLMVLCTAEVVRALDTDWGALDGAHPWEPVDRRVWGVPVWPVEPHLLGDQPWDVVMVLEPR